ncbi:MAG: alanine racemase [Myxococcota bacterium]
MGERPTVASIDLGALAANYAVAERLAAGRIVIAVVKADAYGHGAVEVSRRLLASGCARLAVATVAEAVGLRVAGVAAPLLVLGGVHGSEEARIAREHRLTPVVHEPGHVSLLAEAAQGGDPWPVHLEVDTGMRRMGVAPEQARDVLTSLASDPGLDIEGIYTHLACADEEDLGPCRQQLQRFRELLGEAAQQGIRPALVHVANSAALLAGKALEELIPEGVNAVRPGLMLYGVSPAPHLPADLRPVMSLCSRVAQVRRIHPGEGVGYGWTWRANRSCWVATLPIGYEDGVPWSAAHGAEVWLRGRRRPLVGRVSMDFITVDAGEGPVEIGDEAIVFGAGPPGTPTVEEAARVAGTIPYELLVRVGARVPRVAV